MKKFLVSAAIVFIGMFLLAPLAQAESEVAMTPGMLGFVLGGGQGGMDTDEINDYEYIYIGTYFEAPISNGWGWRFSANYYGNAEHADEWFSSSTSGISSRVQNFRFMTGPTWSGEANGWWYYNYLSAGADYENGEGFLPVTVIQDEFLLGSGYLYNYLVVNARFSDEENYESYYLRDQLFIRLTHWLAFGPQVQYVWFQQWDDEAEELSMEYEPAWGGQIRFSPDEVDPDWHLTVGYTHGDFVGGSWGVDFWLKVDWAEMVMVK